jgi:hypothetical protein
LEENFRWPPELLHHPLAQRRKRRERGSDAIPDTRASRGRTTTVTEAGGSTAADFRAEGGRDAALVHVDTDERGRQ